MTAFGASSLLHISSASRRIFLCRGGPAVDSSFPPLFLPCFYRNHHFHFSYALHTGKGVFQLRFQNLFIRLFLNPNLPWTNYLTLHPLLSFAIFVFATIKNMTPNSRADGKKSNRIDPFFLPAFPAYESIYPRGPWNFPPFIYMPWPSLLLPCL